jgi:hypothetical protein
MYLVIRMRAGTSTFASRIAKHIADIEMLAERVTEPVDPEPSAK